MPSRFDELCRTHLDPIVDQHFGEPVRFMPMKRTPNGRAAPDHDREVVEAVAVVTLRPHRPAIERDARSAGKRGVNSLRSIVEGTRASLSVRLSAFQQSHHRPQQGDHVDCTAGRFEIVTAQPDGTGRLECGLVAASGSAADP